MNFYALEKCADIIRITDPSWSKEVKAEAFINALWQHSVGVIKQNMASGRIMSADEENYMHFLVLQHLNILMESLATEQYENSTDELIELMTSYRDKGGNL